MNLPALRNFIQREIDTRDMSMNQFASFIDVANSTMSRVMNERTENEPSLEFLSKLAEATSVDICTIVGLLYPSLTMRDAAAWLLVEQIRRLPEDDRRIIDNYLAGVARKKG